MIDVHVHLLPAVDDGARSLAVSVEMLERARALGYRRLVATPHLPAPLDPATRDRVAAALGAVRPLAAERGVEVLLGCEAMLTPDLLARLAAGEAATLGGSRAVLVEVPLAGWPHHADDTLFRLRSAGYRPVLAHPERYAAVQRDPARAEILAARGTVLQVTIGSLVGLFGRDAKATAERLLRDGTAHLVATDAHSAGHRFAAVSAGLARIRDLVGEERLAQLVEAVPRALLADGPLPDPPRPARRRSWFGRLVGPSRG